MALVYGNHIRWGYIKRFGLFLSKIALDEKGSLGGNGF